MSSVWHIGRNYMLLFLPQNQQSVEGETDCREVSNYLIVDVFPCVEVKVVRLSTPLCADSSWLAMRPTLANLLVWLVLKLAEQSCIHILNNNGLNTHPLKRSCIQHIVLFSSFSGHLPSLCKKAQDPVLGTRSHTEQVQLLHKLLWQDSVKSWLESVGCVWLSVLQVSQTEVVQGGYNGIFCRLVFSACKF